MSAAQPESARRGLLGFWLLIQEPRVVTVIQTLEYLIVLGIGMSVILRPPTSIRGELGPVLMDAVGMLLMLGGALGVVGTPRGIWWVERLGIIASCGGLLIYLSVVVQLEATTQGSRLLQLGVILLAVVGLIKRWARISRYQYDPER